MALAIITAVVVITLRLILHAIDAPPAGTDFMLVHFLAIATIVFFTDLGLLRKDRAAGFPALVREGFCTARIIA